MIIGKPRKKFTCRWLQLRNCARCVISTRIWSCIIGITYNFRIITFKEEIIKSMSNSNSPKIEPCGTPYSILFLSLELVLILILHTRIISQLTVYDQWSQMLLIGPLKEHQIHCLCPQILWIFLTWQVSNAAYCTPCHQNNHKVGYKYFWNICKYTYRRVIGFISFVFLFMS